MSIFNADKVLYTNAMGYTDIINQALYTTGHIENIGSVIIPLSVAEVKPL